MAVYAQFSPTPRFIPPATFPSINSTKETFQHTDNSQFFSPFSYNSTPYLVLFSPFFAPSIAIPEALFGVRGLLLTRCLWVVGIARPRALKWRWRLIEMPASYQSDESFHPTWWCWMLSEENRTRGASNWAENWLHKCSEYWITREINLLLKYCGKE